MGSDVGMADTAIAKRVTILVVLILCVGLWGAVQLHNVNFTSRAVGQQHPTQIVPNQCFVGENQTRICIPSVICPGFQKSGTSYLWESLHLHPMISGSDKKEVNYYVPGTIEKGLEWYANFYEQDKQDKVFLDFSPSYMMVPPSAEYIKQTNPYMRFIVTMRDPTERAYGQYEFQQKYDAEYPKESDSCKIRTQLTFKQVIADEYRA